jgi:hypothetical protein
MKVKTEIIKKVRTENHKIYRIGDNVSFNVYRESLDEYSIVQGIIYDIEEEYIYLKDAIFDGQITNEIQKIPYILIDGESCKFVH